MALHFAAGYGNEEAVEALLSAGAPPAAVDTHGDAPLHLAAAHGHPMSAFSVAKAAPSAVMLTNSRGQTPVDVAALCQHHEVDHQYVGLGLSYRDLRLIRLALYMCYRS
jgi:Ankyrin repeats (3 copies)